MGIRGKAFIAGAYEHPDRVIPDKTIPEIHAEVAMGALKDAGLSLSDVDGYALVGGDINMPAVSMADYLGLKLSFIDSTFAGGSSPMYHIGHAVAAIAQGKCSVVLVSLANRPRSGIPYKAAPSDAAEFSFEAIYGTSALGTYALAAKRHMYEFGTTSEQLAAVRVTASHHAQHNPHALLKNPVTIEEVLASPMLSDPLHRMDCCVITDSGGAVVLVKPEIARELARHSVKILGQGEAPKHTMNGLVDVTYTGARWSGPRAFEEAGVTPADVDYASIYDSFTITVIETIEDLGFCEKGKGGPFVLEGNLEVHGKLPVNTDGGGLCNNHPSLGGITRIVEALRQLRGEAAPEVQVPNCEIALAHGTGGSIATRMASATLILGQADA